MLYQKSDRIDILDAFTRAYIVCALWSSTPLDVCFCEHTAENHHAYDTDNTQQCKECDCIAYEEGDASFQSLNYDEWDVHPDTLALMVEDCRAFQERNTGALEHLYSAEELNYTTESAGHDFWLTREGHGAGFWDRYYGENKAIKASFALLTDDSRYHPFDLYLGDDGKVHGS